MATLAAAPHRRSLRFDRWGLVDGALVRVCLALSRRRAFGYRVDPGGGSVLGIPRAIGLGALSGQSGDHSGDRLAFEVG